MLSGLKQFSLPEVEEKVLEFWRSANIFERSVSRKARKAFTFYEGPPTANGKPGIHHILARSFKDIIPRYKTMRGFSVSRKGGWDTHGLPVEIEAEKQLGLQSKREIEAYGIANFNAVCKASVWKYKDEWERLTERMGYWIDLNDPYVTYENRYMDSVWWILREVSKKKLLYKGHKVVPWCTRCGTGLSSHELALGYKEVTDTSVFIKFKVLPGQKIGKFVADDATYILSWTTTPWTLPGNVALAVGENIDYVIARKIENVEQGILETYVLAKNLVNSVFTEPLTNIFEIKGKDIIGVQYEPLFKIPELQKYSTPYRVYGADFVTTTDGTGVVHTAVMYGEDDYNLGKKIGLPQFHTVDEQGRFITSVPEVSGMQAKDPKTEHFIFDYLEKNKFLLRTEKYKHEYPFCWRCGTPLLYYARDSWFINMSSLQGKLKEANSGVHWIPDHVKNGRFGEWISGAKDWAISRSRYWGTPIPVWECDTCDATRVVGGVRDLSSLLPKTGNRYVLVRHGFAENNLKEVCVSWPEPFPCHLTLTGRAQIDRTALAVKRFKPNRIISSDLTRTKETAEIISQVTKLDVSFDARLRELDTGDFNGRPVSEYDGFCRSHSERFEKATPNGESFSDVRTRVFKLITELEEKYQGETIVLVSHEGALWMVESVLRGWSTDESIRAKGSGEFIKNGEHRVFEYLPGPRDASGAYDLHRPYIDAITFPCTSKKCKGTMHRIPEVLDVWFDSGAMPFAQSHYPFESKSRFIGQKIEFPADYISEGIDQTRGWFYTLLAISVLLGKREAYKNVISLGLILDKNGQKMSKSKGNVVDPWEIMSKYGADAVRWYFYTVNPPGESKRFDEGDVGKALRQFVMLAYNSFVFFDTYAEKNPKVNEGKRPVHILDRWLLSRTAATIDKVTKLLDAYEIGEAARVVEQFTGDLSRWFIRRSRRRLQRSEDTLDYQAVSYALRSALITLSKLSAPFIPFFAEALYRSLVVEEGSSVHLADWPTLNSKDIDLSLDQAMADARDISSAALAERATAAIKVRQPLQVLKVKNASSKIWEYPELIEIIKDEVNVKEIIPDASIEKETELDRTVTPELREEGMVREFIRVIQDFRQDAKLSPHDTIKLSVDAPEMLKFSLERNEQTIIWAAKATSLSFVRTEHFSAELDTEFEGQKIWIGIERA